MRKVNAVKKEVLARAGKYKEITPEIKLSKAPSPLKVKQVWHNEKRYIACLNSKQARKDEIDRDAIIRGLKDKLKGGAKSLVGNKGYRKYLKVAKDTVQLDQEKIKEEKHFDGKWVLTANVDMPAKQIALKYKEFWMVEHVYSNPADMTGLTKIAKDNKLYVIEDCAEALGAIYNGQMIGSLNNISCFFTNLQAVVGLAQLERIDWTLKERERIFNYYNELLINIEEIQLPFKGNELKEPVNWLYTIIIKSGGRDELINYLKKNNIDSRPAFYPCHKMPYIKNNSMLKVTEKVARSGISIPTFVYLRNQQIETIVNMLKEYQKTVHEKGK